MKIIKIKIIIIILLSQYTLHAQPYFKGIILNENKLPLVKSSISIFNRITKNRISTSSDLNGYFRISSDTGFLNIKITQIGYEDLILNNFHYKNYADTLVLEMNPISQKLAEVIVSTGTRSVQRTIISTPLPIDIIGSKEIENTGQSSLDKVLEYTVPSFNTINVPIRDATTLIDPYEIRNLGPSRTLILINGKRKNLSSLLYVQFTPGRGETGADLSAIPVESIERIEILRDGSSAQYGSDAIAGVVNVILKSKISSSVLNLSGGITSAGDGGNFRLSYNAGFNFGNLQKGFFNYTIAVHKAENTVRAGNINPLSEISIFGNSKLPLDAPINKNIIEYLKVYPTANSVNGSGATHAVQFLYNAEIPISKNIQLYSNAAIVLKNVLSNAVFRTPYWVLDNGLLHTQNDALPNYSNTNNNLYNGYVGFLPTFEGNLLDYNATLGLKGFSNGWRQDMSLTIGGNGQSYLVNNTINAGLGLGSPINFHTGGFQFEHIVGNLDFSKQLHKIINFGFGAEFRRESFTIIAGDTASYTGGGAVSFPGIQENNAGTFYRNNIGGYVDLGIDITPKWLVNGTLRTERYSDFGSATVWKISSLYNLIDNFLNIRSSYSTGFRAPSLHQIYNQSTQTTLVNGIIVTSGLFNNQSKQASQLGIPKLKPELSNNFSFGIGLKPTPNFTVTLDYYFIEITNRILLSSSISTIKSETTLYSILQKNNITSLSFFINALESQTSGIDIVTTYKNINLGSRYKLNINLAGNYQLTNKIIGNVVTPPLIEKAGSTILNQQIASLITSSRPKYKANLGLDFNFRKLKIYFNNTLFGPTEFQDIENSGDIMEHLKQEFLPAIVTDINFKFEFSKNISAYIAINNLLNILPKWDLIALDEIGRNYLNDNSLIPNLNITKAQLLRSQLGLSGRFNILGTAGSQFSQFGTTFNFGFTLKF